MLKKNSIFKRVYAKENNTACSSGGLVFLAVFLALYIALPQTLYTAESVSVKYIFLALAIAAALFVALTFILSRADHISVKKDGEKPFSFKLMFIFAACAFALFFIWWYSYYPGGYEMDSSKHWYQIASGDFSDWHPAIYNILLWLCGRVIKTYTGFLLMQQFFLSLALGYMGASMRSNGVNIKLCSLCVILAAVSPLGGTVTNYLGKDNAFAFFMIIYFVQLKNIYLSGGEWLAEKRNTAAFALVLCFVTLMRHNGVFATLAAVILLICAFKKHRRRVLAAAVAALCLIGLIRGPLYSLCGVSYSDTQVYEETIGLPLTMMGCVMHQKADMLPETAYTYMTGILTREGWEEKFYFCWNDVKWIDERRAAVQFMGAEKFAEAFIECIKTDPDIAFYGALKLTGIVWRGGAAQTEWAYKPGVAWWTPIPWALEEPLPAQTALQKLTSALFSFTSLPVVNSVFWFCGFWLIALLICSLIAYKKHGAKALVFAMSIFAYDMGTSLMLCGYDLRFFYFNFLITLPACIVLLLKKA